MADSRQTAAPNVDLLRRRVADLEQELRISRRRVELLEGTARRAFNVGAWGVRTRPDVGKDPEP